MKILFAIAALTISSNSLAFDICKDYQDVKCETAYVVGEAVVINGPLIVIGPDKVKLNTEQSGIGACKAFGYPTGTVSMKEGLSYDVVTALIGDNGTLRDLTYSAKAVNQLVCTK